MTPELKSLSEFYFSIPHPCDYLTDKTARMLFIPPDTELAMETYSDLVSAGFRRSGGLVYRPHCSTCNACVPIRIPVGSFQPNRSQRRCWRRNQSTEITVLPAQFKQEHYDLYRRYLMARHGDGSMADSTASDYMNFLICRWCETEFIEFKEQGRLIAVAVADRLTTGLSAVYTFFEPALPHRGLGTFAILQEIQRTAALGLQWLYLGYWIGQCHKMAYKVQFRPAEIYRHHQWQSLSKAL